MEISISYYASSHQVTNTACY